MNYSPETKQHIKDSLYRFLYSDMDKYMKRRIRDIIKKNDNLYGKTTGWLVFRGKEYSTGNVAAPRFKSRTHAEVEQDMIVYTEELKSINNEMPYVLGFITHVLNRTDSLQDYLVILPSCLHPIVNKAINECPCGSRVLSDGVVQAIQKKEKHSIDLIKGRLAKNLIFK